MATNPSIILSGNNINDVVTDQRAKLAQADAMQKAAQLQTFQVESAKQSFQDEQNFRKAFMQANGDPALTVATAAKLNVGPARIQAFMKSQGELQKQLADLHKTEADTGKTKLESQDIKNSEIYGQLKPALDAKTPEEFEKAKSFALQRLKSKGLISDKEYDSMSSASQDDALMYANGLLNVKQNSDLVRGEAATSQAQSAKTQADKSVEKQADEHAKFLREDEEKRTINGANDLYAAYRAGGPVAYAKVLSTLKSDVAGNFAAPEQIAQMKPGQVLSALNNLGMTANEREQLIQKQQEAAALNQYRASETADRRQQINLAERRESRAEAKESAEDVTPETASSKSLNLANSLKYGKIGVEDLRRFGKDGTAALNLVTQLDPTWTRDRAKTLSAFRSTADNTPGGKLANLTMLDQHLEEFKKASKDTGYTGAFNPLSSADNNLGLVINDISGVAGRLQKGGMLTKGEHDDYVMRLHSKLPYKRIEAAEQLQRLVQGRTNGIKEEFYKGTGWQIEDAEQKGLVNFMRNVPDAGGKKADAPQAAPKVASMDHLKAYAAQAGMSVEQAAAEARKAGYKVQ